MAYGEAPYLFNNDNSSSYYATLETSDGAQVTMWGVGIKAALEEHDVGQGDKIELQKGGKVATTIQEPLHDEVGNVTGYQEKQVYRNEWTVDVLERAIPQPIEVQTEEPQPLQKEVGTQIKSELTQQADVPPPVSSRAQQMMEEAQLFQKEKEAHIPPEPAQPANEQAPEKDRQDDLGLREGEANKLQAQNEMPTLAQINTSSKADVDSDVRFKDVGDQSIPSELSKDVQSWVNNPTPKQSRLNGRDQRVVSMMKSSVQDTLSALEPNARKQALRNYNENLDAAINGTTLNVPEHLKQELQQQNQQQTQHQQWQVTPPIRGQEPELEL